MGNEPVKLTFGNGDCGVWDNAGAYKIEIMSIDQLGEEKNQEDDQTNTKRKGKMK